MIRLTMHVFNLLQDPSSLSLVLESLAMSSMAVMVLLLLVIWVRDVDAHVHIPMVWEWGWERVALYTSIYACQYYKTSSTGMNLTQYGNEDTTDHMLISCRIISELPVSPILRITFSMATFTWETCGDREQWRIPWRHILPKQWQEINSKQPKNNQQFLLLSFSPPSLSLSPPFSLSQIHTIQNTISNDRTITLKQTEIFFPGESISMKWLFQVPEHLWHFPKEKLTILPTCENL